MKVTTPAVDDLPRVLSALASFQGNDDAPPQLHPGDAGWNQKDGAEGVASALRVWERDGEPIAIGMLDDEASVLRLAISPAVAEDLEVATHIANDLDGD